MIARARATRVEDVADRTQVLAACALAVLVGQPMRARRWAVHALALERDRRRTA